MRDLLRDLEIQSAASSFQSVDFTVILGLWVYECALRFPSPAGCAICFARKQCVCGHLLLRDAKDMSDEIRKAFQNIED